MKNVLDFIRDNVIVQNSIKEQNGQVRLNRNLQHFISLKPFEGSAQALYEKILSHAITAERIFPGGGKFILKKIVSFEGMTSDIFVPKTKQELIKQLISANLNKNILNMLLEALDLVTTQTTFLIKKSTNSYFSVEYNEGYKFDLTCHILNKKSKNLTKPKIICIDGYIENVSEIHHLLQKFSETQEVCLLFCRGMSDDVRHTIKVNLDRSTLNMIPYITPFDVDSCNTLVDIAIIAGCDVVSTTKGQLISSIKYESLGSIEKCECLNEAVVIYNNHTRHSVLKQIENLKKKIEERSEIEDILSKRIRSLTASCIEFRIPDDLNYQSNCQQLDEGIRVLSKAVSRQLDVKKMLDDVLKSYESLKTDLVFTNLEI